MLDAHDTHCCIDHGCKYSDEDCPVANGVRKQCYPCEQCGLETEDYYDKGVTGALVKWDHGTMASCN